MIVEFVGESGCGKTTLAGAVLENTKGAKKRSSLTMWDNLACMIRATANRKTRKPFLSLVGLEISTNGFSRLFRNTMYAAGLFGMLLSDQKTDSVWIVDQGIIQFLQTVFFHTAPRDGRYADIIKWLISENDYYVIACRCDYDTLCERIRKRQSSVHEVSRRIESADRDTIRAHAENLRLMLSQIPEDRRIIMDTAEDLQANADRVCKFIGNGRNN